jgi:hypothetical protein
MKTSTAVDVLDAIQHKRSNTTWNGLSASIRHGHYCINIESKDPAIFLVRQKPV